MDTLALFTDVSLNPQLKIGVGAYFLTPTSFLNREPDKIEKSTIVDQLVLKRFNDTSSTKLEVQTVLWALDEMRTNIKAPKSAKLNIYTDSQCITGLLKRRTRLETNDFLTRDNNRLLKNAILYREFYQFYDEIGFGIIKVAGHVRSASQDTVHRIFSYVDRKVRKELKLWVNELNIHSRLH